MLYSVDEEYAFDTGRAREEYLFGYLNKDMSVFKYVNADGKIAKKDVVVHPQNPNVLGVMHYKVFRPLHKNAYTGAEYRYMVNERN